MSERERDSERDRERETDKERERQRERNRGRMGGRLPGAGKKEPRGRGRPKKRVFLLRGMQYNMYLYIFA